jgi:hypothetical protein
MQIIYNLKSTRFNLTEVQDLAQAPPMTCQSRSRLYVDNVELQNLYVTEVKISNSLTVELEVGL